MGMNILSALLLFFIQPTFLVGVIVAIGLARSRKKQERKLFRVAINKDNHEVVDFFLRGLLPGLIGSLLIVSIGVPITVDVIIFYQILAVLSILAGLHFVHPAFTIPLATLAVVGVKKLNIIDNIPTSVSDWYQGFTQLEWSNTQLIQNLLLITVLILFLTAANLTYQKVKSFSPKVIETKRGKKTAAYRLTPFWLIPLVLIIPGESFTELFEWWPVFTIGNDSYSFFILPVLSGFRYTVQSQVPKTATKKIAQDLLYVAVLGTMCFIGSFWMPIFTIVGMAVMLLGGAAVLLRHHLRERNERNLYTPANQGLKVIGIRPETPGEKMGLHIGETVVMCNETQVETEEDFYRALSKNSVYCHLKVKDLNGELRLTETALYADDPHGLGIVFLA